MNRTRVLAFALISLMAAPAVAVELKSPIPNECASVAKQAVTKKIPPFKALTECIARYGPAALALSSPTFLSKNSFKEEDREFLLRDGTKIGGLFFEKKNPYPVPLIIANMGALTDRRFNTSKTLINIFREGLIDANLLVVDSVSSAGFYVDNRNLSLGGYDEGRVLFELASWIKTYSQVPYTTIHLMGFSLGGLAVIQALLEDERLGTHLFQSGISFSGAVDEEVDTQTVLNTFGRRLEGSPDTKMLTSGAVLLLSYVPNFNWVLKDGGITDFSLPYSDMLFTLANDFRNSNFSIGPSIGDLVYREFQKRLRWLDQVDCYYGCWNPAVRRSSVEAYIHDSSALVAGIENLKVPLILVHAQDDTVIPFREFEKVAIEQRRNPFIQTLATEDGGHGGFQAAYGDAWVAELLQKMLRER